MGTGIVVHHNNQSPTNDRAVSIGYTRNGNLRPHLQALGYSLDRLLEAGLIGPQGPDTFCRRVIFPCRQQDHIVNLYGRSIRNAFPHHLLPHSKGGLFARESVRQFRDVILVEGLFDLAVLWQAGFRNTTCAIGTHPTPAQLASCTKTPDRCVYIAFNQGQNQAGQNAAYDLLPCLDKAGLHVRVVELPAGHAEQLLHLGGHRPGFYPSSRGGSFAMSVRLVVSNSMPASASPYRLLQDRGCEITWANQFSMLRQFANSRCAPCAPRPMTCSTWHAGSKVHDTREYCGAPAYRSASLSRDSRDGFLYLGCAASGPSRSWSKWRNFIGVVSAFCRKGER